MNGTILFSGVFIALVTAFLLYKKLAAIRKLRTGIRFPGPVPHFLLENLADIGDPLQAIIKFDAQYSSQTESGIWGFWLFGKQVFVPKKNADIKKVLHASSFREEIPQFKRHMDQFLGDRAIVSIQNEEWKLHRRIISKAFQYSHLATMNTDMAHCTALLRKYLVNLAEEKKEVEISCILKSLTLDIIGKIAFGYDFESIQNLESGRGLGKVGKAFEYLLLENTRRTYSMNPLK
jgi:cytochrome P450